MFKKLQDALVKILETWRRPENRPIRRIISLVCVALFVAAALFGLYRARIPTIWALGCLAITLAVVFTFEIWDQSRDTVVRFLTNWSEETKDFRRTFVFFGSAILLGLIFVALYEPCCPKRAAGTASAVPNADTNRLSATLVQSNLFQANGLETNLVRTNIMKPNAPGSTANESVHEAESPRRYIMTSLLWSLACLGASMLGGFVFGIPEVLQADRKDPGAGAAPPRVGGGSAADDSYRQLVNTNLTDISDWITKIIVGLGLINLKVIPDKIKSAGRTLSASLEACGCGDNNLAFAVAIIIFFCSMGFLFGYLMTRLFLAAALSRAEAGAAKANRGAAASSELVDSFLKDRPASKGADATGAQPASAAEQLLTMEAESAKTQALAATARTFQAYSIQDPAERGRRKDQDANEIARLVLDRAITKDWLVEEAPRQALNRTQDGLIAGLAVAVNIAPEPQDLQRLARVAPLAEGGGTRYKIAVAIGKLFSTGLAGKDDVPQATTILAGFLRKGVDDSLRNRIREIAALITRSTGISLDLPL